MERIWKIRKKAPKDFLNHFKDYHPLLLQLLYNRGIKTKKEIKDFLSIDYEKDLYDPFLLSGMKKAVLRIKKAIEQGEKIAIFGDYDADGICALTILNQTLKKIGTHPLIYIPDRKKGYGLNKEAVRTLAKNSVSLIIAVDCGVSDYEEIKLANELGMDVIVADHHLIPLKIPDAYVILNPQKKGDKYPNKDLAGAGVAFKLASALIKEYQDKFKKGEEKWLLDLVAIATIADMMPLFGENRTLVKYGLLVLAKTQRLGLKALIKEAGLKDIKVKWIDRKNHRFLIKNINAHTIGFIIGPRLNAAGRMEHANKAFYLLNTNSQRQAYELASMLNRQNQARQKLQNDIVKLIKQSLKEEKLEKKRLIIRGDKSYPKGIVGLISGKLTDEYYLPSFIYQKEKTVSRGSCRGIPEINIVEILQKCSAYLKEYGGHRAAAGFSLKNRNLSGFKKCLEKNVKTMLGKKKLLPKLEIDAQLKFKELTYELKRILDELEPCGLANPEPVFAVNQALVLEKRKIGKKAQHLMLRLKKIEDGKDYYFKALLFQNAVSGDRIEEDKIYDFAFVPLFDEWQGRKQVTLKIIDWQLAN